ncbi:polymorphic toxin type 28 domain-containing protein [Streptomyces cacaoi]|uniref:polymorphic toxin type 28 domain-containing protein n=1 Tax=Streptomyces cacaoi TaxID=1898 RepID=UPI0037495182
MLRRAARGAGPTSVHTASPSQELHYDTAADKFTAQRYYSAGDATAVRTETGLSWMVDDHHGTASMTVDATTQAVTRRYTKPFGESRGVTPSVWPDDKGFLGKPVDADTGLTHVGAREYDPVTGRFLSVDPVLAPDDHESLNGYAYANNTPVTKSDPTGLRPRTACETGCSNGHGGTDYDRLEANGKGGWTYVSTEIYHYSYPDGSSLALTVTSSGGIVSYKVNFKTGPSPLPTVRYGSDSPSTATPSPSPGMAPDPNYKGSGTGPSWGIAGEIALAACGWVPMAGAGCDAVDLGRSAVDKDAVGISLGAVGFIPLAGDAAKLPKQLDNIADAIKLANKTVSSPFTAQLDNAMERLKMEDLTGAARELKGEVVKRKANGVPWDHVQEVRETQNRLVKIIGRFNSKLGHPKTGDAERELLVADLGRASRMLDYSAHYVPRQGVGS